MCLECAPDPGCDGGGARIEVLLRHPHEAEAVRSRVLLYALVLCSLVRGPVVGPVRFDDHALVPPHEVERPPADLGVDGRLRKPEPPQPAVELPLEMGPVRRKSDRPSESSRARDTSLALRELSKRGE